MALSIKNEETSLAVARLAALMGLTMTEAIRLAVEEKIARLQTKGERIEHILALGQDCANRLPPALKSAEHASLLYGPNGLPG